MLHPRQGGLRALAEMRCAGEFRHSDDEGERKVGTVPESISKLFAAILASTKTHKWWWAGGGGATLAAIIAVVIVFGGFFGPSGALVCKAAVDRARDYGVIPGTATAGTEAKQTDVTDRRVCEAQAGDVKYNVTADLTCKDLTKADCLTLYSVESSDGKSTYQMRAPEEDVSENAPVPGTGAAPDSASPAATPDTAAAPGSNDSDIAVSHDSAAAPTAPPTDNSQPAPQP